MSEEAPPPKKVVGINLVKAGLPTQFSGGQPTKYRQEYCEKIIEFMANGGTIVGFAASIRVSKYSIYTWAKTHPEFSDALHVAQGLSEAYWENVMMERAQFKGEGSDGLLTFFMKNRFGWSEKVQQDVNQKTEVTYTSVIAEDGSITRTEENNE